MNKILDTLQQAVETIGQAIALIVFFSMPVLVAWLAYSLGV